MTKNTRMLLAPALVASLTLAAACNKDEPANDAQILPPPSTTIAPPATPMPAAVTVTDVKLGKAIGGDRRITDEADKFKPNDMIYLSVLTTGSGPDAKLLTRWTYENGQLVSQDSQMVALGGPDATEFHIAKPDGFPKGKYKAEVMLNGVAAGTKEFEIK